MDPSSEHPTDSRPDAPAGAGTVIGGRYRLEARIAAGGMASVWEAHDEVLARSVAVKVLHPHLAADEQFVARFRREAVSAARLTHPSIVAIYDTCAQGETEAIVMELVRGTTLRAELDRRGRFSPRDAAHVVAEIADALAAAHAAGVVHRDVKPANVLLSRDGRVLVTDFGIAKAADGMDLTGADTTLGTAKYLAPEQVDPSIGPVDARADVYAAGVILYELLCGQPPFAADTDAATALARLHRDPVVPRDLVPDVDPAVEAIALRAMARQPDARYSSAGAFREALRAAAAGEALDGGPPTAAVPVVASRPGGPDTDRTTAVATDGTRVAPRPAPHAPPPTPAPPPRRKPRRWSQVVGALLVVAAVAVAGVLWAGTGDGGGNGTAAPGEGTTGGGAPIEIADVRSFDPEDRGGGGAEHEEEADLVVDGSPDTRWRTSCYASPAFGGFKDGLGLIVELSGAGALSELRVESPNAGWTAEVYVAATPANEKAAWGEPVAEATSAGGTTTFPLGGVEGGAVLLWFTGLGEERAPSCEEFPHAVAVTELAVV